MQPIFLAPHGTAADRFAKLGEVHRNGGLSQFDNTRYGHYRGARWLVLLRELAYLPRSWVALKNARANHPDIDIVHVNEFTALPTWLMARALFRVPFVVHVRSVARIGAGIRTKFVSRTLREKAEAVVAIDETVRASLPADLPVDVIHNSFRSAVAAPRSAHTSSDRPLRIGFVGNLIRVKGILDLVDAARLTQGLPIQFLIVGAEARSSLGLKGRLLRWLGLQQNVGPEVLEAIQRHQLNDRFKLVGFTDDVAAAYRDMDILCFPSHYDAPGRPIFEAAFSAVPSIVAVRDPKPDTLIDGVTGLAVPPRDPAALAAAFTRLVADRDLVTRMGAAAQAKALERFDPTRNASRLLALYQRVLRIEASVPPAA